MTDRPAPARPDGLSAYIAVTAAYWAFMLTDGALRMLVLLHFHTLGYSPLELAMLFLLYEFMGMVTNLIGGWVGSRFGLKLTLSTGLALQVTALLALSALNPAWPKLASVILCAVTPIGVFMTYTRSVYLSLFLSFLILAVFGRKPRKYDVVLIVMAVLVIGSWLITSRLSTGEHISRWQVALETIVSAIRDQIEEIGTGDPARYLPFVGTLFLFIASANLFAIVPGYVPPTGSLSTTAALAICVLFAVPIFTPRLSPMVFLQQG